MEGEFDGCFEGVGGEDFVDEVELVGGIGGGGVVRAGEIEETDAVGFWEGDDGLGYEDGEIVASEDAEGAVVDH